MAPGLNGTPIVYCRAGSTLIELHQGQPVVHDSASCGQPDAGEDGLRLFSTSYDIGNRIIRSAQYTQPSMCSDDSVVLPPRQSGAERPSRDASET
jgi:hypothetical protein